MMDDDDDEDYQSEQFNYKNGSILKKKKRVHTGLNVINDTTVASDVFLSVFFFWNCIKAFQMNILFLVRIPIETESEFYH